MEIRFLRAEDQPKVQEIMVPHPWQFPQRIINIYPERWSNFLDDKSNETRGFFVADEDGEIVGHAGYIYNESERLYEIVGVVVKNTVQGKGIGTQLIDRIREHIKSLGANKVFLHTLEHPANEMTMRFYQKLGFKDTAHDQNFWGPALNRVTYVREVI